MTNPDTPDQVKVEQLMPCPFCGGGAHIAQDTYRMFYPSCNGDIGDGECPGVNQEQDEQGGLHMGWKTKAEAIAAWNRRASLTPPVADSTGMREALKAHHEWHLAQEPDGLGVGGAEAYCDSGLFDQTVAALANQSDSTGEKVREAELGCDYCRNDGPLTCAPGWAPRCPRCDAEYPEALATPSQDGLPGPAPVAGSPVDGVRERLVANLRSFDPAKVPAHKMGMWVEDNYADLLATLSTPATPTAPVDEGLREALEKIERLLRGKPVSPVCGAHAHAVASAALATP